MLPIQSIVDRSTLYVTAAEAEGYIREDDLAEVRRSHISDIARLFV